MKLSKLGRISLGATTIAVVASLGLARDAEACTRILWNDSPFGVISSRSMDWEPSTSKPLLVASPRGVARNGSMVGTSKTNLANSARWKAKYGSVFVTAMDSGTSDGMNEKGLTAHALWLNATNYGARDVSKPGVNVGLWAQYILDNATTVNQAIKLAQQIQVTPVSLGTLLVPLSLAVEDPSGDSAIFQYIDGKLTIHHGAEFRVLSNDPPYDEALKLVNPNGYANATRNDLLPGNTNSEDRFVRATFYLDFLRRTHPASLEAAKAGLLSAARNVSDPIGAPMDTTGSVDETDYRTLSDLTHRTYSFEPTRRIAFLTTDLTKLDFRVGQPIRTLNPLDPSMNGDVTARYKAQ
jgi:choloylglycine hydrolase